VLNGKMDESEWKGARPLQFETGGVTTSLKLLYTEDALYVGALLSEPLPGQIRAKQTSHDGQIWTDDSIELFFCPGSVVHHYYQLIVNSRGTIYDGTGNLKSTNSADWNTSTSAAASVERDHWCAEIRIPWSSFGLKSKPKPREDWTADFRRWRFAAGTEQYSSWAGAPLKGDTHHPEAFKTLHFGGAK
jgi:hypothetical protein